MNKIISTKVISADKLCTHRLEVIVEFDEPISFFDAQTIVCNAIGDYMARQNEEQSDDKRD